MIALRFGSTLAFVAVLAALPFAAVATEPAATTPTSDSTTVKDCYDERTGELVACEPEPTYHYDCVNERGEMVPCEPQKDECTYQTSSPPATDSGASGAEATSGDAEWYDANANGKVDDGERGEPASYACPGPTRAPECESHYGAMEEKGRALQQRHQEERASRDANWKARYEEFSRANHTEEEWKALHAEQEASYREMDERHAREWSDWRRASDHTACVEPAQPQRACEASYHEKEAVVYDEKVRSELERLHKLLEERRVAFHAELRAEYERFTASDRSDDELARFKANMQDRMASFEVEQQAQLLEWKQRMSAEYGHYAERSGWACAGVPVTADGAKPLPATAPAQVRKHHEKFAEWEQQRLAFELELRIAYADFLDAQNAALDAFLAGDPAPSDREVRAFEARQDAERLRFELDMREQMRDFESRLREEWASAVGADLDEGPAHERFGSFAVEQDEATGRVLVTGKYVAFEGDPETQTIGPHTVQGQRLLDALYASVPLEEFEFGKGERGTALHVAGEGLRMSLHDHPSGLMKFHAKDGATVQLDFADHLDVEADGKGVRVSSDEVAGFLRASDEVAIDEATNTVTLTGEATFLLRSAASPVLDKVANKHRGAVLDAVESGSVAAEVTLVANGAALEGEELEYGAVDVQVEATDLEARTASLLIESAEHAGKTIVVNLDREGFGLGVDLAFYELAEDGGEQPAAIVKAESLADVLDPADDDTAEYWVVVDEDGTQVLVSIPHFSAKRLEIQGSATSATPNIVLIGGMIGAGVIGVALVVWSATRRLPGSKGPSP